MTLKLNPDEAPTALAKLLLKAVGDRTLKATAEAWGIQYQTLRRLVLGQHRPSDDTILQLVAVPELSEEDVAQAIADDLLSGLTR